MTFRDPARNPGRDCGRWTASSEIYIEREKEFALVGSLYKGRVANGFCRACSRPLWTSGSIATPSCTSAISSNILKSTTTSKPQAKPQTQCSKGREVFPPTTTNGGVHEAGTESAGPPVMCRRLMSRLGRRRRFRTTDSGTDAALHRAIFPAAAESSRAISSCDRASRWANPFQSGGGGTLRHLPTRRRATDAAHAASVRTVRKQGTQSRE